MRAAAAARLLLIVALPWLAAIPIALALAYVPAEPCDCTTDSDCMQKCGGDGSPE